MMRNFNKISGQRGTLLVEALAMLGLIALVTPTLYKKSAERLQEIQDINTASQARTMYNIVDTFMKTNYSLLMAATSSASDSTVAIGYNDGGSSCTQQISGLSCFEKGYSSFVPFGFTPGDLKNYQAPHIYVHRDKDSLVAYILFPAVSSSEIGKKRAARVASLVGANGGVVSQPMAGEEDSSNVIYGTGGAWRLDSGMISEMKMDENLAENSLVVTSPEPISMSNMDSEKFLYRVPPDDTGKDYHNTMVTDLYLGGHPETDTNWATRSSEFFSIFNVRKLTLNTNCDRERIADNHGSSASGTEDFCNPDVADLYIGKPQGAFLNQNSFDYGINGGNTGAAWIYGNLAALNESFRLFREGDTGVDRDNGNDVMEFSRRGNLESSAVEFSVFRAENTNGSARVSIMDNFLQVFENGTSTGSGGYELRIGSSSHLGDDSYLRAYRRGNEHVLTLNSPDNFSSGADPSAFITEINRHGGTVYINGGSSDAVQMNTVINEAGGHLWAGKEGSWVEGYNTGGSSVVKILNGDDLSSGTDSRRLYVGGSDENSSRTMIYGNRRRVSLAGGALRVHGESSDYDSSNISGLGILSDIRAKEVSAGVIDPEKLPIDASSGTGLSGETAIVSKYTDILGSTFMGVNSMDSSAAGIDPGIYTRRAWTLGVAGNAWIDKLLFARRAWFNEAGLKELHAGFSSYADYSSNPHAGWLDVYEDRFIVRDRTRTANNATGDDDSSSVLMYATSTSTGGLVTIRDLEGARLSLEQGTAWLGNSTNRIYADSSAADSSAINVIGSSLANVYTDATDSSGVVNLQKDALRLFGQPKGTADEDFGNTIAAKAEGFIIQTKGKDVTSSAAQFYANNDEIRTRYVDFSVQNDNSSAIFRVMPNVGTTGSADANVQVHGSLHVNDNKVIHVASDAANRAGKEGEMHSMLEVDPEYVQIWASADGSSYAQRATGSSSAYYAMFKVNPTDIGGGSSTVGNTENASVYVRRGAIELEPSKAGLFAASSVADSGVGYIKANRLVSDTGLTIPKPTTVANAGQLGRTETGAYDQYMVNPAYTSVMHDIKLTTRGGARLSDALPDFVLKGVYNLVNNCKEGDTSGNICTEQGMGNWASPFIGLIPYPSCPPGYRSMATVVPISFNMGQAGTLIKAEQLGKGGAISANSWVVNPYSRQAHIIGNGAGEIVYPNMEKVEGYTVNSVWDNPEGFSHDFSATTQRRTEGWFSGLPAVYDNATSWDSTKSKLEPAGAAVPYDDFYPWKFAKNGSDWKTVADALYFQQNTWLKTTVNPRINGNGWDAYMGFIYDATIWKSGGNTSIPVLSNYNTEGYNDGSTPGTMAGSYAWNVFPIPTNTIEGHATVYCYFDRDNFSSGWGNLIDTRDPRKLLQNNPGADAFKRFEKDSGYVGRLNDPSLKYDDPW